MNETRRVAAAGLCAAVLALGSCGAEDANMDPGFDHESFALQFAERLAARNYEAAHAMTSGSYRRAVPVDRLQADFEAIVPADWGPIGPIETGRTMDDWPGKRPGDLGWVYVSIGGDVYSEALIVVVTVEQGEPRIRDVEFGRP